MNGLQQLQTPLVDKLMEVSSNMLIVFKILVEKFNLTLLVYDKVPQLQGILSPNTLTFILTIVVGLIIVAGIFAILINLCKFTLNFLIFAKWAAILIFGVGFVYNWI